MGAGKALRVMLEKRVFEHRQSYRVNALFRKQAEKMCFLKNFREIQQNNSSFLHFRSPKSTSGGGTHLDNPS